MSEPGRAAPDLAYADTNVFVALFATDEHPLHARALRLFQRVAGGELRLVVTPLVIAELVYVAKAVLGWRRSTVAERLGAMLDADGLEVREMAAVARALALYGEVASLDFADAYVAGRALEEGPTVVASFDSDFDRVAGIRRVSA